MLSVTTILHPTDFSPSAEEAFQLAETLAGRERARLVVLHVLPPSGRAVIAGKARVELRGQGDRAQPLAALRRMTSTDPGVSIEHRLTEGEAAAEILHVAQENQADLIVMGSRGRTGLTRLALGSVADQVLCRARCPVVTVSIPAIPRMIPAGRAVDSSVNRDGSPTKPTIDGGIHDARTHAFHADGATGVKIVEPLGKTDS
jgi:nucleotide-binding universal stress UspA family protein